MTPDEEKIEEILNNREKFDKYVYCSIYEAIEELEKRKNNKKIDEHLDNNIVGGVPELLKEGNGLVLFRNIANLNYETTRFVILTDALENHKPIIFEYHEDQFNNRNENKFYLGKISLYKGENKKGESMFEHKTIIDINDSNSKPLHSIETIYGKKLIDFHHEKFFERFGFMKESVHDLSWWLHQNGGKASEYYKKFLMLFLKNGILLENFLPNGVEQRLVREIVLPAIIEIEKETGMRPLIVALEPTSIEGNKFWLSYMDVFLN